MVGYFAFLHDISCKNAKYPPWVTPFLDFLHLPCYKRLQATRSNSKDPVGTQLTYSLWTTWPTFCWESNMVASICKYVGPYQKVALVIFEPDGTEMLLFFVYFIMYEHEKVIENTSYLYDWVCLNA